MMFRAQKELNQHLGLMELACAHEEAARVQAEVDTAYAVIARIDAENAKRAALWRLIEATHEARHDPLTGLPNRRALGEEYEHMSVAYIYEQQNTLTPRDQQTSPSIGESSHSMIMMDLDNFKDINDTFGHHTGDKVIIRLADIIKRRLRASDIVARVGGEEFVLILPRTDEEHALALANDLREIVEQDANMQEMVEQQRSVTVSLGAHQFDPSLPLEANMDLVDRALYAAKNNGRNQVVKFDPSLPKRPGPTVQVG